MMYAAWLCAVSRVKRPARGRPQRGEGKCDWGFELRCECVPSPSCRLYRVYGDGRVEREFFSCLVHVVVSISASGWSVRAAHVDPAALGRTAEYRKLEYTCILLEYITLNSTFKIHFEIHQDT